MKNILFILLIVCFYSCKEENKKKNTEIKQVKVLDTIYCDSKPTTTKKKLSMYNSHYTSIISIYPLKDQKIIVTNGQDVEVCYQNEIEVVLLKNKDTVYNITVNRDTVFNNISPYDKRMFKEKLKSIKLDSIILRSPRTEYLYYNWHFTDHTNNKEYNATDLFQYIGKSVGKLDPYSFSRLINSYLKEQTLEQINQSFGEPLVQEIFLMDGSLPEFRGNLEHYISKEEYTKDSISIKEVTWRINKDDNVTIWYQQRENNWKAVDVFNWNKNAEF